MSYPPFAVAVLYARNDSIYKKIPGCDVWAIDDDARTYDGPFPIIAHPPCGHWGKYRHNCTLPGKDCASIALSQVRTWSGILEHPIGSELWRHCVTPDEGIDMWGGRTIDIDQHDYGHRAKKPTRLYLCKCGPLSSTLKLNWPAPRPLESLSRKQRQETPLNLALALVQAATFFKR